MKISQIKINGVRGFSYQKDLVNNIDTPHQIDIPKNSSFILFGENGTGKSSFFDALEWALTGEIEEEGRQRRLETKNFIRNINSTNSPKVSVSFHGRNGEFTRELGLSRQVKFDYEDYAPYHFIESNRITVFVTDTKSSLWRRFLELIGLDELLEFQTQISYARNTIESEVSSLKEKLEKRVKEKQKLVEENDGLIKSLDKRFEVKWRNVILNNRTQIEIDSSAELKRIVDETQKYLENINNLTDLYQEFKEIKLQLQEAKLKTSFSSIAQLLEQAENYFRQNPNIENCPVCNENTITRTVIENITVQKANVQSVLALEKDYAGFERNYEQKSRVLLKEGNVLLGLINKRYQQNLRFENEILIYNYLVGENAKFDKEYELINESISLQISDEFRKYNQNQDSIAQLDVEIIDIEREYLLREEILKDYEAVATKYKSSYDNILEEELKSISKEFVTDIYNQLNQTSNEIIDSFNIEHDVLKQEIKFSAILKTTGETIDPINMLSTAHLKCLGFALLMARVKKKNSVLKFIAIDDPIYAIDHEHRYSLINYLCNEADNYQLIITTSDRNFYDIFRNKISKQKLVAYKTYLQITDFPHSVLLKESPKSFIDEARLHLSNDDFRASAVYARIALENCLFQVAKKERFRKELEIAKRFNIPLDDIFKTVENGMKSKYESEKSNIDREFGLITNNPYFNSLLTGTPLNKEVHQSNELAGFLNTRVEIEEIIEITDSFQNYLSSLIE